MTINYGTLTNAQKEYIHNEFERIKDKTSVCHAAACISDSMTDKSNSRIKSNAFAAVLTYLVWQERVNVNWN
jgi:hypothetical protein